MHAHTDAAIPARAPLLQAEQKRLADETKLLAAQERAAMAEAALQAAEERLRVDKAGGKHSKKQAKKDAKQVAMLKKVEAAAHLQYGVARRATLADEQVEANARAGLAVTKSRAAAVQRETAENTVKEQEAAACT